MSDRGSESADYEAVARDAIAVIQGAADDVRAGEADDQYLDERADELLERLQ